MAIFNTKIWIEVFCDVSLASQSNLYDKPCFSKWMIYYITLPCIVLHCIQLYCIRYNTVLYLRIFYCVISCHAALFCIGYILNKLLYCFISHWFTLYCTIYHCTHLHCILYCSSLAQLWHLNAAHMFCGGANPGEE